MTSTTVTTKTGKQINLSINDDYCGITAKFGEISFGAEQTATGFKTRFAADIGGGKRSHIDVMLEGEELAKSQALFAELRAAIARRSADQAAYDRKNAAVRKMMAE